ncbi:MAG: tryptophan--tRNA ligase [Clostridiales bacterium]
MTEKQRVLSGMRPTGRLHLGHYSVIENWDFLSPKYDPYFFTEYGLAFTTQFDHTYHLRYNKRQVVIDYISAGLDPCKCHIFHQSDIKEHAELNLLMAMITPLSWLERVPTYKGQLQQFKEQGKDIATYGFLGYPLLMSADILMYRPVGVPVGEDQVPHCEFTRELARRFNNLYGVDVFPEPEAILSKIKVLPGTDNRKMSKSYDNYINLSFTAAEVKDKVWQMVTDPARIRKTDPGHPDICAVHAYHGFYNQQEQPEICANCKAGLIGCGDCKKKLTKCLNDFLDPIREKRAQLEQMPDLLDDIIAAGNMAARKEAVKTMEMVREAIKI